MAQGVRFSFAYFCMSGESEISISKDCTRAFTTNVGRRNAAAQLYPSGQSEVTIADLRAPIGSLPMNEGVFATTPCDKVIYDDKSPPNSISRSLLSTELLLLPYTTAFTYREWSDIP